jgi:hypothetical protein
MTVGNLNVGKTSVGNSDVGQRTLHQGKRALIAVFTQVSAFSISLPIWPI